MPCIKNFNSWEYIFLDIKTPLFLDIYFCLEKRESITLLAREYHIGSRADIRKWIAQYKEHGIAGLSTTHGTYTGKFKVSVVEYMYTTGASIRATTPFLRHLLLSNKRGSLHYCE